MSLDDNALERDSFDDHAPQDVAAAPPIRFDDFIPPEPEPLYHFEAGERADVGEFLRALDASGPGRQHCVVFKKGNDWNRYEWCPEGEDFADWIQRQTAGRKDCGYSWNAFDTSKTGPNQGRKGVNALAGKSIMLDADVGTDARLCKTKHKTPQYATAHLAARDLAAAWPKLAERNLLPNWVGSPSKYGGFHLHYVLDEAATPEEVTQGRRKLRAVLEGPDIGLRLDPSVRDSATQVVRIPGSIHGDTDQEYVIYRAREELYTLAELDALPAPGQQGENSGGGTKASKANKPKKGKATKGESKPRKVWRIVSADDGCLMAHEFTSGKTTNRDVYRAVAGILHAEEFADEGATIFDEECQKYPQHYDKAGALRDFDGWEGAPTRCGAHEACKGCQHNDGSIGTPAALASEGNEERKGVHAGDVIRAMEASGLRAIRDQDMELLLVETTRRAGRAVRDVMHSDSRDAKDAIRAAVLKSEGKAVNDTVIEHAAASLRYRSRHDDPQQVHLRSCSTDAGVFIRLRPGYVARVTAQGVQIVDDAAPGVPLFTTSSGGAMPEPVLMGSPAEALAHLLARFGEWNISERDATMLIAVLLTWLRTGGTMPIVEFVGPGGKSGKTSLARLVMNLVDPTNNPKKDVMTTGTKPDDVAAVAQGRRLLVMDNITHVDRALGETMCRVATGADLTVRQFHEQRKTITLSLHRGLLLTALTPVCRAPDLLSRVVRIRFGVLANKRPDTVVQGEIAQREAEDFGAVLTLLSGALGAWEQAEPSQERLSDFGLLGEAALIAAGQSPGVFNKMVADARREMGLRTVEGDRGFSLLARLLLKVGGSPTHAAQPSRKEVDRKGIVSYAYSGEGGEKRVCVEARPGGLLTALKALAGSFAGDWCPRDYRQLDDLITEATPAFSDIGAEITTSGLGTRPIWVFDFNADTLKAVQGG